MCVTRYYIILIINIITVLLLCRFRCQTKCAALPCPVCFVSDFTGRFIVAVGFFTVFPVTRSYRRSDVGALAAAAGD